MIIAVNLNTFPGSPACADPGFLETAFAYLVRQNTDHHFIFISSRKQDWAIAGENLTWVQAGPLSNRLLRWRFWQFIQVPALLKKLKADILISTDCFTMPVSLPQCIIGADPGFLQQAALYPKKYFNYFKKNVPLSYAKAKGIIVPDEGIKNKITSEYAANADKIAIAPPYTGWVSVAGNSDKDKLKAGITEGKEYFINTSTVSRQANLMSLLKAFSLFKKRQQTGMKLVLAGKPGDSFNTIKKDLASYKYRDDVVLTGSITSAERNKLIAASYGLIDTSFINDSNTALAVAFSAEVPVISSVAAASAPVIYTDANDITDIAAQMMLLYKDEYERLRLIEKGKAYAENYSIEKSAAAIWQAIQRAAAAN